MLGGRLFAYGDEGALLVAGRTALAFDVHSGAADGIAADGALAGPAAIQVDVVVIAAVERYAGALHVGERQVFTAGVHEAHAAGERVQFLEHAVLQLDGQAGQRVSHRDDERGGLRVGFGVDGGQTLQLLLAGGDDMAYIAELDQVVALLVHGAHGGRAVIAGAASGQLVRGMAGRGVEGRAAPVAVHEIAEVAVGQAAAPVEIHKPQRLVQIQAIAERFALQVEHAGGLIK